MASKILIVDDDPDIVEAMRLVLEARNYQVVTAYDPTTGLRRVEQDRPDLVILDVMMPEGTEGFHFVWNLRAQADETVASTPILLVTAIHDQTRLRLYPDQKDSTYDKGEFLPVQGFIDKPVTPEALLNNVEEILAHRGKT